MKWTSFYALAFLPKILFASSALTHYENFYDAIEPAVEKNAEAFVCYTSIPDPLFNVVMHLSCDNVQEKVSAILSKKPEGKPISFWVHPENKASGLVEVLQEKGFGPLITCPLFSWKVAATPVSQADIRKADMKVFHQIMASVYGMDEIVAKEFASLMNKLDCENYLIYENGVPIGTASLFVKGSVGGIFNDATFPGRREATKAMTEFLMNRSEVLKLEELVLLSSPEGESLYTNLGFTKVFDIQIYGQTAP